MAEPSPEGIATYPEEPTGLRRLFMAFQVPGFRWLWLAGTSMSVGWTVESLAQGWLVLQLTDSPFWVGAVSGVRGVCQFLMSIPGGALADRLDRRRLVIAVHLCAFLTTLPLIVLVFTKTIAAWHMLIFAGAAGTIGAINAPATNTLTYDVVGGARLLNAAAFRFLGMSLIRIVGALAGGFILDWAGPGGNYTVAAGASMVATGWLLLLKPPARPAQGGEAFTLAVKAGLRYAMRTPPLRRLLLLSLATEFFAFSYLWMMPVMARDVLDVGARGLGYLSAMQGVGMLTAMLLLVSLGDFRNKGGLLLGSTFGFGLFIALFGLSPWFALSLFLVGVVGGMGSLYDSSMSTMLQLTVSEEMRGRVMGLYTSTWGLNQVGGLALGGIATALGAPIALAITGGMAAANALRLVRRAKDMTPRVLIQ